MTDEIINKQFNFSCRDGAIKDAEKLLNEGADVNNHNGALGRSPIIFACEFSNNIDLIRLLIKNGAELNYVDERNSSALHYAIKSRDLEVISLLLENNINVNHISVLEEFYLDDIDNAESILIQLMKFGLNFQSFSDPETDIGGEILIKFVETDRYKTVERILSCGANIEYFDNLGYSPLMVASDSGDISMVKLLVENGADLNNGNKGGCTPLMAAALRGNINVVRFLIEKNCDYKAKDEDGWSAIKYAQEAGDGIKQEVVDYLKSIN